MLYPLFVFGFIGVINQILSPNESFKRNTPPKNDLDDVPCTYMPSCN